MKSISMSKYAQVLYDMASERGKLHDYEKTMRGFYQEVDAHEELEAFLNDKAIHIDDRMEIVEQLFHGTVDREIISFIRLLLENNRLNMLDFIIEWFEDKRLKADGYYKAEVITAVAVDDEVMGKIRLKLQRIFKVKLVVKPVIDPAIIGGVMVKAGDMVIDGSIKHRVNKLARQMMEKGRMDPYKV